MAKNRVKKLSVIATIFLIVGYLFWAFAFGAETMALSWYGHFFQFTPLVVFIATPLYLVALWVNRTEKVLTPGERRLYWFLAFVPFAIAGSFGWFWLLVVLILRPFLQ